MTASGSVFLSSLVQSLWLTVTHVWVLMSLSVSWLVLMSLDESWWVLFNFAFTDFQTSGQKMDIILENRLSFWRPVWKSMKSKSEKYLFRSDCWAKIYCQLTLFLKTRQLRSCYFRNFPVVKVLKTTTQAPMSNLRAHLKKIHADLMCQFDEKMKTSHKTRLL